MKKVLTVMVYLVTFTTQAQSVIFNSVDINSGSNSSYPQIMGYVNGKAVLYAYTPATGTELFISDGTPNGTKLLKDIEPGTATGYYSSQPGVTIGKYLYFIAGNSSNGTELWVTDGTTNGTNMVKDINNTSYSSLSIMQPLVAVNGRIYFTANNGINGSELWASDGTEKGTVLVKDIQQGVGSSFPDKITELNGKIYFTAFDSVRGFELWKSDGTASGTSLLNDLTPGFANTTIYEFKNLGKRLLFFANVNNSGFELWATDGNSNSTQLIKEIYPGPKDGINVYIKPEVYNGKLYFVGKDSLHGEELWSTDGTATGTMLVKDIFPGKRSGELNNLTKSCNKLYFTANDSIHNRELWSTDGTPAGTALVADIYKGIESGLRYSTTINNTIIEYNNKTYFLAQDTTDDLQIWQTDGTIQNTKKILPPIMALSNALSSSSGLSYNPFDKTLYFPALYDGGGFELWTLKDTSGNTQSIEQNQAKNSITVYPNPNKGVFSLQLSNLNYNYGNIIIYDYTGKVIYKKDNIPHQPIINMKIEYPKGLYLLQVQLDDAIYNKQIVIE